MKRIYDERDTLFSRVRLEKGTKRYEDYYARHPEKKEKDDAVRGIGFMDNLKKDPLFKTRFFPLAKMGDAYIANYHALLDKTPTAPEEVPVPKNFHKNIKAMLRSFGACESGMVELDDGHFYSHHGGVNEIIGLDNYGVPIKNRYKSAIVFLVEMDTDAMRRAPDFEVLLESQNAYQKAAEIGSRMAFYLKKLGYEAQFQSDGYYLTPQVPLALDAGLGEVGMSNHLINPRYGDRVRIGSVLTNLELKADTPLDFGLEAFCDRCALCLINCPMQSIKHKKRRVNGRLFYRFDEERCFKIFKNSGTDCAVCIQSCPFSYGISEETIAWMKNDRARIDRVIKAHLDKKGRRPRIKNPLDIVRSENNETK